jgi:two-component system sensor histidine kinase HydH
MKQFIKDSLRLVENQAKEKAISIHTEIKPKSETARIDPEKINQVLLNLYLNAIEAMETKGSLTVSVLSCKDGSKIGIRISDSGIGIGPQDLSHIFDPYFTTKATGTGLGLAIVHNIIEAHNGEINVKSRMRKGTTFTIWLAQPKGVQNK